MPAGIYYHKRTSVRELRKCKNPNCDIILEIRVTDKRKKYCSLNCCYEGKKLLKEKHHCKFCGKEINNIKYCNRICYYADGKSRSGKNAAHYGKKHPNKTKKILGKRHK